MTLETALENIKFFKNKFMREEVECIRENKAEAIPVLLEYARYAGERAEELERNFEGHMYAMFLLAEFGVRDAFEPIIKYLELPGDAAYSILGDILHEDIYRVLGTIAVFDDIDRLKRIIEALRYKN